MVLNIATNGAVPGGAKGGVWGMIIFGGLALIVLSVIQKIQKIRNARKG